MYLMADFTKTVRWRNSRKTAAKYDKKLDIVFSYIELLEAQIQNLKDEKEKKEDSKIEEEKA